MTRLMLASLPVDRMMTAPRAVLLQLKPVGRGLLVLCRRIVTALALRARQSDHSPHEKPPESFSPQSGHGETLYQTPLQSVNDRSRAHIIDIATDFAAANGDKTKRAQRPCGHRALAEPTPAANLGSCGESLYAYSMILETRPEPTVWPPSRIAKRRPSSMAMG